MALWRKDDPVLNDDKDVIKGGMFGHQRSFWDCSAFIRALITGYGGGKTLIGAKHAIALALENAPAPHLAVSPSYKMARRTVIPTLDMLLDGKATLLPGFKWHYHKSHHEYSIHYKGRKARIWIASGNDPDSLKGPNIGSAWIDEPFIQEQQAFKEVNARVRDKRARVRCIDLTGTPEELNWGYDICEGEEADQYNLEYFQADTSLNLALPDDYLENLNRAFTDKAADAYIGGKFVNLQRGRVFYAFTDENVVDLPDPGGELKVGMDFNVDPMAAVVFWVAGNHMHVVDEIELPNSDTDYMCGYLLDNYQTREGSRRIKEIFPDPTGRARKTAAAGRSDFAIIRNAPFNFEIRAKSVSFPRDRENAVNGMLCNRKGERRLTISPKCKKLRAYFQKYTHEGKNTAKGKSMSHLVTALEYPTEVLFPRQPTPIHSVFNAN